MALSLLPVASLSLLNGTDRVRSRSSLSAAKLSLRSPSDLFPLVPFGLHLLPFLFLRSVSGDRFEWGSTAVRERCHGLTVRAGKATLCMTKRSRSRKSLARTHGFQKRMRTTSGKAVLMRRRAKGREVLCTKSNANSGKMA